MMNGQEMSDFLSVSKQLVIAREQNAQLLAKVEAYQEALTPSAETKARYWGGDDLPMMNWGDIKDLMRIIQERAEKPE